MRTKSGRIGGVILVAALAIAAAVAVVIALPDGTNQAAVSQTTETAAVSTVTNSSTTADTSGTETSATAVRIPSLEVPSVNGTGTTEVPVEITSASGEVPGSQTLATQAPTSTAPMSSAVAPAHTAAAPPANTTKSVTTAPIAPIPPSAPKAPEAPTVPASTATAPKTTAKSAAPPTTAPVKAPVAPSKPNFTIPVTLGNATQLITVTAASTSAKTATLRAWQKGSNGTWKVVYGPVKAQVGSAGIGKASESSSRTPLGTYTLTETFGRLKNPGTAMPYHVTGPNDWWVSDTRAASYNTWQTCAKASCSFRTSVSEHLQFIKPYYDYAVVMDVNRSPVVKGAGSAFFLHVSVGQPTAGCVAIDKATLVKIMQWLSPSAHPRIATGIG